MNTSKVQERRPQRFVGKVVSAKMQNTVVVEISRKKRHPKYHKTFTVTNRLQAHDDIGVKTGDVVTIEATRPISKMKKFKVVK